jgi:hypothetical protein
MQIRELSVIFRGFKDLARPGSRAPRDGLTLGTVQSSGAKGALPLAGSFLAANAMVEPKQPGAGFCAGLRLRADDRGGVRRSDVV